MSQFQFNLNKGTSNCFSNILQAQTPYFCEEHTSESALEFQPV